MSETVHVCDVALDPRNGGSEAVWTYRATPFTKIGDAVFVPLAGRMALGFVVSVYQSDEANLGFPLKALKNLSGKVEGLELPPKVVDLARFVSREYLCTLPVAMSAATPPGVRDRLVACWTAPTNLNPEQFEAAQSLPPVQKEALRVVRESNGLVEPKGKKFEPAMARALKALRTKGLVEHTLRLTPQSERRKGTALYRLTSEAAKIDHFLQKDGKRRPAQAVTLMRLQTADQGSLTAAEIRALAGVTDATVKALADAGLLERVDSEATASVRKPPTPNPAQQIAIDAIVEAGRNREPHRFLLFGVTGSGKTEVYLRSAAEVLREGRQILYVVPEIALAAQVIAQLRERFGKAVAVLHSDLPDTERLSNWQRICSGQASVVLGARSALFAPIKDLGLIIVDEEHEQSYKQESAPRYHAKQVALKLAELHQCPVVLGSATPSIESYAEADKDDPDDPKALTLLTLPQRAASARLPEVHIEDLTEGYRRNSPSILTPPLKERMVETLARGEQVILFLNRRAYAPFLICRDCGHQIGCPHCSVSLSYHRKDGRLRCHHCGFHQPAPDTCPSCNGSRISSFGIGTEKVEEFVAQEFPEAKVARLDRDIARRKGALEETLAAFRSGDLHILVGTQIIAKGLDFPNVTLVGVIAADISLNIPDFRSSERTFQLLSQVAGRAGRGQRPGTVVIQTFNAEHPALVCSKAHDYGRIYDILRVEREEVGYPPFKRLVNVVVSGEDQKAVTRASNEASVRLRPLRHVEVLGPVDCPVERAVDKWRRHLLLKMEPGTDALSIAKALAGLETKDISVVIDVDPYTLM